ncbi:MAG: porin [Pseudomonadales bacterium]|uniref:Porin n=1 Tax=Oleiphilus messinensis TaxID=141451 RepID=A0A1Y0I3T4_9GAMM|nr:porin [Oleiphilus messinensis]ARU55137.1 porin [Oleiphilus messinensis]MCG8612010.1 porin [Pseudomonadales bacterium]
MNYGLLVRMVGILAVTLSSLGVSADEDISLKFNGYLTAAVAISDEDRANYFGITDKATFNSDSIVAIQAEADINDRVSATIQLLANGRDDYSVEAEWIFLSYKALPDVQIRGGRLRLPSYMISDYVEVGYAYPWVRPPHTVYGLVPIFTFDGVDLYYTKSFGQWSVTAQPFYGSSKKTVSVQRLPTEITLSNMWGFSFSVSNDWFLFRAGHAGMELDLEPSAIAPPAFDKDATLSSIGMEIKWNNWLSMAEYTQRYTDIATVPDINGWYVLGGYRFGEFLPHVTFESARNNNSRDRQTEQDSVVVGLRWDAMDNLAVKFEAEAIDVKSGSVGGISYPENITVWTIAVDTVF